MQSGYSRKKEKKQAIATTYIGTICPDNLQWSVVYSQGNLQTGKIKWKFRNFAIRF